MTRHAKLCFLAAVLAAAWCVLPGRTVADDRLQNAGSDRLQETAYDYNGTGRLIAVHRPDGTVIQYEYGRTDSIGQAGSGSDGRVVSVSVSKFDEKGLLKPLDTPEGPTHFQYDRNGNRIQASNKQGVSKYYYDEFNRLTKAIYNYSELKKTVNYQYDPQGRIAQISAGPQNGASEYCTAYSYDAVGRVVEKNVNGLKMKYSYDQSDSNQVVTRTLPNDIRTVYRYDGKGAIEEVKHFTGKDSVATFQYKYNTGGQLLRQTETVAGKSLETNYRYDKLGQLVGVAQSNGIDYKFQYDHAGALRQVSSPTGPMDIHRNAAGLVDRFGDMRLTLDQTNRPVAMQIGSAANGLAYDSFGRLKQWTSPTGTLINNYTAEGFPIGNRLGAENHLTVPNALSPTGSPLLAAASGKIDVAVAPDLLVRFGPKETHLTFKNPFGDPWARMAVDTSRLKSNSMDSLKGPMKFEAVKLPQADFSKIASPSFGGIGDLRRGPSNPLLDLQLRALGGHPPSQAIMRVFEDRTDNPRPAGNYDWVWNPRKFVYVYGLNLASTAADYAGVITSALPGFGAAIGERTADVIGQKIIQEIEKFSPGLADTRRSMHQEAKKVQAFYGLGQTIINLPNVAESFADIFETKHVFDNFNGKIVFVDDSRLLGGKLMPAESQGIFGQSFKTTININRGSARQFVGGLIKGFARDQILDAAKSHLLPPRDDKGKLGGGGSKSPSDGPDGGPGGGGGRFDGGRFDGGGFGGGLTDARFSNSLSKLGMLSDKIQPKGVKFDKPAEFVGKIGAIRGLNWDPETKRMVLVGDGNPALPPVRLDDFITAIRIVYSADEGEPHDPTFSLDPADPANPSGDWLESVYRPDLLAGSHMGMVMLRADWSLKQYTLGVIADYDGKILGKRVSSVPGYQSYLQLLRSDPAALNRGKVCNRFWILPWEMKLERQGDMLIFVKSTMRVETRRMEMTDGGLHDSPDKSDPLAETFANHFTAHYDKFANESPVLEEVREAAKVVALVKWLKKEGVGVNEFMPVLREARQSEQNVFDENATKQIHSVKITESLALWGLPNGIFQLVGGVELAPRLVQVPVSGANNVLRNSLSRTFTNANSPSAGEVVTRVGMKSDRYRYSTLPLTRASREFVADHPVYVKDGATYARDSQGRIASVLDESGNSLSYAYDTQDRLTEVCFRNPMGWEMRGETTEADGRTLRVESPNRDAMEYSFDTAGNLSETKVNGRTTARLSWNDARDSVTIEHIRTVVQPPDIGELSGPKEVEKAVVTEVISLKDDEMVYQRRIPGRKPETIRRQVDRNSVTYTGTGLPEVSLRKENDNLLVEQGPAGRIKYQFDSGSGLLEKLTWSDGSYLALPRNETLADGSKVILRAEDNGARAEMTVSADGNHIRTTDFNGQNTVRHYRNRQLQSVDSPWGRTRYQYAKDGERLTAVIFPDGSVRRFEWQEGLGVTRLKTWREIVAVESQINNVGKPTDGRPEFSHFGIESTSVSNLNINRP